MKYDLEFIQNEEAGERWKKIFELLEVDNMNNELEKYVPTT